MSKATNDHLNHNLGFLSSLEEEKGAEAGESKRRSMNARPHTSFYVRKKRLTSTQLRGRTLSVLDFLARPWCYHYVSPRANFPANCQWTKGWVQLSGLHLETKSMQSMLLTPRRHRKQRVLSRHARHYFWRRNDSELELSPKCKCVTASNEKLSLKTNALTYIPSWLEWLTKAPLSESPKATALWRTITVPSARKPNV